MTVDFNIKDNDWDPLYSHHSLHTNILKKIADLFNLKLSTLINQFSIQYTDNPNNSNLGIDLIFLQANSKEFNNYSILPNLQSLSNYALLIVDIILNEEFI